MQSPPQTPHAHNNTHKAHPMGGEGGREPPSVCGRMQQPPRHMSTQSTLNSLPPSLPSAFAAVLWPSVPFTVADDRVGVAYGLTTAIQNGGLALFPLVAATIYKVRVLHGCHEALAWRRGEGPGRALCTHATQETPRQTPRTPRPLLHRRRPTRTTCPPSSGCSWGSPSSASPAASSSTRWMPSACVRAHALRFFFALCFCFFLARVRMSHHHQHHHYPREKPRQGRAHPEPRALAAADQEGQRRVPPGVGRGGGGRRGRPRAGGQRVAGVPLDGLAWNRQRGGVGSWGGGRGQGLIACVRVRADRRWDAVKAC